MSKKDVINVDTRKLAEDLNSIKSSLDNMQSNYKKINDAYDNVKVSWKGEAGEAFMCSFSPCLEKIEKIHDSILDDVEELIIRCNDFYECEQHVIEQVKRMGWDG